MRRSIVPTPPEQRVLIRNRAGLEQAESMLRQYSINEFIIVQ